MHRCFLFFSLQVLGAPCSCFCLPISACCDFIGASYCLVLLCFDICSCFNSCFVLFHCSSAVPWAADFVVFPAASLQVASLYVSSLSVSRPQCCVVLGVAFCVIFIIWFGRFIPLGATCHNVFIAFIVHYARWAADKHVMIPLLCAHYFIHIMLRFHYNSCFEIIYVLI